LLISDAWSITRSSVTPGCVRREWIGLARMRNEPSHGMT